MNIKKLVLALAFCFPLFLNAQSNNYKPEREKINNLVHTKLDVLFDIPNSELFGEAWITLTPHFNPTSKVSLDAKGMIIHSVMMNNQNLGYNYFENIELIIDLDRTYKKGEEFTVYIKYTARPEKFGRQNKDQKGLYFIDPRDEDPTKPTQIWTEGETENNSIWFPTIDAPNQKTTQELSMTVPRNFVTLSNGTLISQKENTDGTRTDTWKQDQKHAPYLVFMAAGEFSIVKDTWKGKEINYYVEKEYEAVARKIFGKTAAMLQFYENLLGVEYPWDKYSQIVVRDYVSGAMENTTAVTHSEKAYQELGELADENRQEKVIAHEVFHHWFGDLVTAESWSNIALNEAFASYGEYLWFEHEYGKDYADDFLLNEKNKYFEGTNESKDLVRFNYESADDMFDQVSYEKGGLILHMLRNYLSDDIFFVGLNKYLTDNEFGTAEVSQLRLALEAVSGKDLNWFFDQWFYGNSHPKLQVTTIVGQFGNQVTINIIQGMNVFQFPLTIDVYESNGIKTSHEVWVNGKYSSFTFDISSTPKLINVGATGTLLAEINHQKTFSEYLHQYNHADNYVDRKIALEEVAKHQDNKEAFKTMQKALNDPSYKLRIIALEKLNLANKYAKTEAIRIVENLAKNDSHTLVRAAANITLAKLMDPKYVSLFVEALNSKSYKVIESGVVALYQLDKENTLVKVDALPELVRDHLSGILVEYYLENREEKYMTYVSKHLIRGLFFTQDRKTTAIYKDAFEWVAKSDNREAISNLTDSFVEAGIQYKSYGADMAAINFLRQMVQIQKDANHPNEDDLVFVIRTGMTKITN